jgi:hypothetical protein
MALRSGGHCVEPNAFWGRTRKESIVTYEACPTRFVFCWIVVAAGAQAIATVHATPAEETVTTIRVAIKYHEENLTTGWKGEKLDYYLIVLSAGNRIQVSHREEDTNNDLKTRDDPAAVLGSGAGSSSWHVIGSNQLEQEEVFPQSGRIIAIFLSEIIPVRYQLRANCSRIWRLCLPQYGREPIKALCKADRVRQYLQHQEGTGGIK